MDESGRKSHAILDRASRLLKAEKIIRILGHTRFRQARRLLEVGCGSGLIAKALYESSEGALEVHAVDVADNRVDTAGYSFKHVSGTDLPYPSGHFDIVITNHVVEHVGNWQAQIDHLKEVRRVLRPDGIVYFAVPNKWRFIEPHYRLPFLSWLPQSAGDALLRVFRKGTHYDCRPLSTTDARHLFKEADMSWTDCTLQALHVTCELEFKASSITSLISRLLPDRALALFLPVIPTFVYLLKPRAT